MSLKIQPIYSGAPAEPRHRCNYDFAPQSYCEACREVGCQDCFPTKQFANPNGPTTIELCEECARPEIVWNDRPENMEGV